MEAVAARGGIRSRVKAHAARQASHKGISKEHGNLLSRCLHELRPNGKDLANPTNLKAARAGGKGSAAASGKLRFTIQGHAACGKEDEAANAGASSDLVASRRSPSALDHAAQKDLPGSWLQRPATFDLSARRKLPPKKVTPGPLVTHLPSGKRLHGTIALALNSKGDASQHAGPCESIPTQPGKRLRGSLSSHTGKRLRESPPKQQAPADTGPILALNRSDACLKVHKQPPTLATTLAQLQGGQFGARDLSIGGARANATSVADHLREKNCASAGRPAKLTIDTKRSYTELKWRQEQQCAFIDSHGCSRHYFLQLPLGFGLMRNSEDDSWPLLIYLHGNDGKSFFQHSKHSLWLEGTQFVAKNFAVVSPVCEWTWKQPPSSWIIELVQALRALDWIDMRRIYLTGNSMGGMGTWEVASMAPDLFAAIAPVAAYHETEREDHIASQLEGMPVYALHSRSDETCKITREVQLWRKLEKGTALRKTILVGVDHTSIAEDAYYKSVELWKWLLKRLVERVEDN